ncbi:MAG: ABC transporter permease [Lachnospiraceae bacterium]|nr:ABC transporter permease [Lachnospiraceae bacterium]
MKTKKSEPLFHIVKRKSMPIKYQMLVRLLAIVAALIVCAVVTVITTKMNPFAVFSAVFSGAFGSTRKVWITLQDTAILLIIALALTPAFKMKFWNIGGEGQVLIGGLGAAACMIVFGDKLPDPVLILIMLLSAVGLGALWGAIPAIFKAIWNTNETLSTLMMNYIAIQIVAFFTIFWEVPKGSGKIGIINQNTNAGWLFSVGNKYLLIIIIAILVTVGMYVYLKFTKHGYEISVVGESEMTARYAGIRSGLVIIRTMIISGGLCGLAGFLLVSGIHHTITTTVAGGQGFTAVMVSWLAQFNPFAMMGASLLIILLGHGASEISTSCGLNQSFGDIITGIILFFIIGCEFFIRYRVVFRKKGGKA